MAAVNATPHGGPPHPDGAPGHDLEALAALAASVLWGSEQPARPDPARPDPARPDPARSEVFRTQSFIRLGGDSLRAMHLSALALDRLGVTMPLAPLMSDEPLSVALSRATPPAGGVGGAPTAPAAPSTAPSPIQQGMWAAERVMGGAPYNLVFLRAAAAEHGRRPLDPASSPPLRFLLAAHGADHHALVMTVHHMLLDGWAIGLVLEEIFANYDALEQGRVLELGPAPRIESVLRHQQHLHASGERARQAKFWERHLAGVPTVLDLPADRLRPHAQDPAGTRRRFDAAPAATRQVVERARDLGITPFAFLLGAFGLTLSRYTGAERLLVGALLAGRTSPELEALVAVAGNLVTVGSFVAAACLLAIFLSIETRTRQPITPLHMFANRNRSGSYAIMLALAAALFGMFFFLTLFVQEVLGYSPLKAGLAFLPVSAAIIVTAQIASRSLPRLGPKALMATGALLAVVGLGWLTQISVGSGYVEGILGPMLLFGLGMGFLFVPLTITAVSGARREESGAASSLLNAMQQVGGSLGLSILVTVFGTASRNQAREQVAQFLANATPQLRAQFQQTGQLPARYAANVLAHGISTAFEMAALFAVLALVVSLVVIRPRSSNVDASAVPDTGG